MSTILFVIAGVFLVLAYLIGARKMYGFIAGINTASDAKRAKMNLPAICQTTGIILAVLGGLAIVAGFLNLAGIRGAAEAWFLLLFLGIWFLVLFVQKYDVSKFDASGKPTKQFYVSTLATSAIMVLVLAAVIWSSAATLRDPSVTFAEDQMTINGLYGTVVSRSDITNVSLLNTPPTLSSKTDGSAILGVYKGSFISPEQGSVLVFAKDVSKPWILIQRNNKPILLCLSIPSSTTELYNQILAWEKK